MDVVVYSPPAYRPLIEGALANRPRFFSRWPAFERASRRSRVLVVVIEQLAGRPGATEVAGLKVVNGAARVVLATAGDPDNLGLVPYARPDELVVLNWLRATLPEAVGRAANGLRARLADAVRASSLSTWLVRALTIALEAEPPLRSVEAWCDRIACVPGTLRYHFTTASPALATITPKAFLETALLLFALERAPSGRSWYALARAVDLERRRLKRAAARVVPGFRGSPASLDRAVLLATAARWLQAEAPAPRPDGAGGFDDPRQLVDDPALVSAVAVPHGR
jgi:hypothetical protein